MTMTSFVPRSVFPTLESLPRSYYLGHHAAGLSKMRTMLSQIDRIIECRDYRIPLTSRNPMFEESLAGRERMIVYTKKDLGSTGGAEEQKRHESIRTWHTPTKVVFSNHHERKDVRRILDLIKDANNARGGLTGSHLMVVGMPNVGKSSLLNALRREGVNKGKVAHTGAQPGVTRKIGTGVKIVAADEQTGAGGVYLLDTPGVFMPYVPDADAMLKLALCGSVKDTVVPPFNLADYLLFHVNNHDPTVYSDYLEPTNDVMGLLEAIANKTGRLQKGGTPDLEGAALWMIQRWRNGHLGTFLLDDVTEQAVARYRFEENNRTSSISQAKKAGKEALRLRNKARRSGAE
ncbi:Mitochondrial GTPase 1 [Fulvia fulva]|uniref:Mitochondrial GTPase 1 n=1 Tax=Passalora fulva TaxID=5499 RepID=A0A9Q8P8S1_PASFU|nr:Mitochondrial GTPase 1 [Fulvia fulva]KAK4625869.1 Mitochondrial GTPase 1 [Fulvia fulva]UJO17297.1 Mitochondrial GTPase 1 [Fulvia fulva]